MKTQTKLTFLLITIIVIKSKLTLSIQNEGNPDFSLATAGKIMNRELNEKLGMEFFGKRLKRSTLIEDPCYQNALCKNQENINFPLCYCDKLCKWFGDCCYDAILDEVMDDSLLPLSKQLKCVSYKGLHKSYEGYVMITSCPPNYENQLLDYNCNTRRDFIHNLPVFDNNGITYANIYCAFCNGIENFTVSLATYDISNCAKNEFYFTSDMDFQSILSCRKLKSHGIFPPSNFKFRTCVNSKHDDRSNDLICRQYQSPIITKTDIIKNYFCNPLDPSQLFQCLSGSFNHPPGFHNVFPLTVLLYLTLPKSNDYSNQCTDKNSLNPTGVCFENTCENSVKLSNGLCYKELFYQNTQHFVHLYFESNKLLDKDDFRRLTVPMYFSLKNEDYDPINYEFYVYQTNSSTQITTGKATIKVIFITKQGLSLEQIKTRKNAFSTYHIIYTENNLDVNDNKRTELTMRPFHENDTLSQDSILNKYSFKSRAYRAIYHSEKNPWFDQTGFCRNTVIETMLMNQTHFDSIDMDNNNVTVFKFSNKYLMVTTTHCRELSEFITISNVSKPDFSNGSITKGDNLNHFTVDTILTYSCMGLSCISLSFAIAIHKQLSLHQTTPGTNTFNILLNMLLSHVVFMVGIGANDNQIVCTILGITIHYFWLTTFAFMTIGIVHIAKAFSKISTEPNATKAANIKSRRRLTIIGYFVGLVVVVISVTVEMVDAIPMKVGYGGKICFPSDYPATVIFVSGPMVLSLAINIACLIVTICAICRQLTTCRVLEKAYFTYLTVYVRLTCLSGLLWVFGLLSAMFENDVINILFIILVGLQGFFISIATTCTSSVLKSFRNMSVKNKSSQKLEHCNLKRLC